MLWQITVYPADPQHDRLAHQVANSVRLGVLGLNDQSMSGFQIASAHGFLLQGDLDLATVKKIATKLLTESAVERFEVSRVGDSSEENVEAGHLVYVLPKPGVTDAQADSALAAIQLLGATPSAARTFRRFQVTGLTNEEAQLLASRLLANESIEQVVFGPLQIKQLEIDNRYEFALTRVALREAGDDQLREINQAFQLSLNLVEMQTIQAHFRQLDRDPTDIELETIAQTWSEHCSHKTLAGRIDYCDEHGERHFNNMLKETIFAATQNIRKQLGERDWCVSVFKDNAGVIKFDDQLNLTFKVETHNRPTAIEPYGGANTGIGGVIRDTLGTGMGAKPLCNTDVFCFGDPNTQTRDLPPGVMHPRRIMQGVVSGVRDYGNRMGIPTINGAVFFDQRYLGNPLVFCGNVGMIPQEHSFKQPQHNDLIVSVGGRTGRDGIRGATFSSAELTESSEQTSSGAVQIGNPIIEKIVVDVVLEARDRGLYHAITDCGAGGFSSAVGEMGEEIGAEVWLDKAPLKYQGLSYTEIWISEAQERMVCSVPESHWEEFRDLCMSEGVEATVIGRFVPTGRLQLKYHDNIVGDLDLEFLHQGRPATIRQAEYAPSASLPLSTPSCFLPGESLLSILSSLNVASKHWIIRQYDHEVLGRSVIKPLVGSRNDGPSDAAVIRPRLDSQRGAVIACGMNPYFGDFDTYHMAASSINEAIRNCVAVGADPSRIAILDNFCWGFTDRPTTLGSLVRAALACRDIAEAYGTPFISGKDSLNNEFSYLDSSGKRQTISIPATLLISALGQVADVNQCVTMDFKQAGSLIYQLGQTHAELGGSHFSLVHQLTGGQVPQVDAGSSKALFAAVHQAIIFGWIKACHDLSEGGLSVALAEMSLAGDLGCEVELDSITFDRMRACDVERAQPEYKTIVQLFSESNSRFVVEVATEHQSLFEQHFGDLCQAIGRVQTIPRVTITSQGNPIIDLTIEQIRHAWQRPLDLGGEYQNGDLQ